MRRQEPELTDEDLERLARLGGAADQIAEAAGIDTAQVRRRLAEAPRPAPARRVLELTKP
ncbi:MAG TPA: hypothetical protein VGC37_17695 [Friedmanniella sp.]